MMHGQKNIRLTGRLWFILWTITKHDYSTLQKGTVASFGKKAMNIYHSHVATELCIFERMEDFTDGIKVFR